MPLPPLPAGVNTTTCTFGNSYDGIGNGWLIEATVTLVLDGAKRLVWTATGDTLNANRPSERLNADAGAALSFHVAQVDQAGWTDGNGNTVTNWHYRLDWTAKDPTRRTNRNSGFLLFSPTSGGASPLDLDNLPDGATGSPVFVPQYANATDLATEVTRATTAEGTKVNSSTYTAGQATQDTAVDAIRTLTDATHNAALAATYVAGHKVSTDGSHGLPAPTGSGLEFVFTAGGLDDIRYDGVSQ